MTAYRVHLTPKSTNRKTGPIPVSTTSRDTCPDACPLKADGCYADGGPLAMHWRAVTNGTRGTDWNAFIGAIASMPFGQLWRHNQAGDLPGDGRAIDADALMDLVRANEQTGARGFTFTHYPVASIGDAACTDASVNAALILEANERGFTVNLSANNPAHADALSDLGVAPVACVLPADVDGARTRTLRTPAGRRIVVCPATYRDTSCAECQLCSRQRPAIVGFPAHGSGARKADAHARRSIPIMAAA